MKAAIIAVGSELLGSQRLDTNSLTITALFERYGVELAGKSVAPDGEDAIAAELVRWTEATDLVVVTGGLGPTADDVTRPAAARAFGRSISIDEAYVESLRERFRKFGREMPEANRRQAEVIEGAEVIFNPRGSAPAQRLEAGGATVFLFPGVPRELEALLESQVEPWLRERTGGGAANGLERAVFKVASRAESEVEDLLRPFYERFGREGVSVLASPGEVQIHLSVRGAEAERRARLGEMTGSLRELAGEMLFAERDEDTLEAAVGRLLTEAGATLTTAESCTGGLLAERLTRVAGSSAFFLGGVVTYSNALKTRLLGVDDATIEAHGAVSEPVARAMAKGARMRYGSDYGVGVTGVAGPGGGTAEKPVGTVHLAVAGPAGVEHRGVRFIGDRRMIRQQASQLALELVRRLLRGKNRTTDAA